MRFLLFYFLIKLFKSHVCLKKLYESVQLRRKDLIEKRKNREWKAEGVLAHFMFTKCQLISSVNPFIRIAEAVRASHAAAARRRPPGRAAPHLQLELELNPRRRRRLAARAAD